MIIKAIYRKNLKMTEGKISAQVAHAILGLLYDSKLIAKPARIIVLGVSDKKFIELTKQNKSYTQVDLGLTEIDEGTKTASAWFEQL